MSFETLLFLLAVATVFYVNFVRPLRDRRRRRGRRATARDAPGRPVPVPVLVPVPGSAPVPESLREATLDPSPEAPPEAGWGRSGGAGDGAGHEPAARDDRCPPLEGRRVAQALRRTIQAPRRTVQAPRRATPARPSPGRGVPRAAELRRLSAADLRGVVVLTTVLGPCRALDDARRDPTQPG